MNIKVSECLGLLVDGGRVLKQIIVKGLSNNYTNNNNHSNKTNKHNPYTKT